jgi:hypothetical protein
MSKMSRDKGKRGEREVAELCNRYGFAARRGQQFSGSPDSPDVVVNLDVHLEVKRTERANLPAAYRQSCADAGIDKEPLVVTRANGTAWMLYCAFEHYLALRQKISRLESELKEARQSGT